MWNTFFGENAHERGFSLFFQGMEGEGEIGKLKPEENLSYPTGDEEYM